MRLVLWGKSLLSVSRAPTAIWFIKDSLNEKWIVIGDISHVACDLLHRLWVIPLYVSLSTFFEALGMIIYGNTIWGSGGRVSRSLSGCYLVIKTTSGPISHGFWYRYLGHIDSCQNFEIGFQFSNEDSGTNSLNPLDGNYWRLGEKLS